MPVKNCLKQAVFEILEIPFFAKLLLFEILGHFQKLFWAKILGVRNFRVFEILGHLPYVCLKFVENECFRMTGWGVLDRSMIAWCLIVE